MNFIDLQKQLEQISPDGSSLKDNINNRIQDVINKGKFILGPEVGKLEHELANFVGVSECISVSSGTDALLISLMALDISPGDEIITTPFSFISTAEAIVLTGAKPVFVDIEKDTYNIDPRKIGEAITKSTKGIIAVSLYGQPANFESINIIAKEHNLFVIEDGAQSFGSKQNNKLSCNLSDIGTTSFFPSKPFGGFGDGGACFTNNKKLAEKIRMISRHGQIQRYSHEIIGVNGRLDTLQAAILLAKLEIFDKEVILRQKVAKAYDEILNKQSMIKPPTIKEENTSVYAQYTVEVNNREEVQKFMMKNEIPTAVHYPSILPAQKAFKEIINNQIDKFPVALEKSKKVLSLPMHPYLEIEEQELIIKNLIQISDR